MSSLIEDKKIAGIPELLYDFLTHHSEDLPFIRDASLHDDISFLLTDNINYLLAPLSNLHICNSDRECSFNISSCLPRLLHEKTSEPTEW